MSEFFLSRKNQYLVSLEEDRLVLNKDAQVIKEWLLNDPNIFIIGVGGNGNVAARLENGDVLVYQLSSDMPFLIKEFSYANLSKQSLFLGNVYLNEIGTKICFEVNGKKTVTSFFKKNVVPVSEFFIYSVEEREAKFIWKIELQPEDFSWNISPNFNFLSFIEHRTKNGVKTRTFTLIDLTKAVPLYSTDLPPSAKEFILINNEGRTVVPYDKEHDLNLIMYSALRSKNEMTYPIPAHITDMDGKKYVLSSGDKFITYHLGKNWLVFESLPVPALYFKNFYNELRFVFNLLPLKMFDLDFKIVIDDNDDISFIYREPNSPLLHHSLYTIDQFSIELKEWYKKAQKKKFYDFINQFIEEIEELNYQYLRDEVPIRAYRQKWQEKSEKVQAIFIQEKKQDEYDSWRVKIPPLLVDNPRVLEDFVEKAKNNGKIDETLYLKWSDSFASKKKVVESPYVEKGSPSVELARSRQAQFTMPVLDEEEPPPAKPVERDSTSTRLRDSLREIPLPLLKKSKTDDLVLPSSEKREKLDRIELKTRSSELTIMDSITNITTITNTLESIKVGDKFGNYVLDWKIGQGPIGVVYKAQDEAKERSVALKIPHSHVLGNKEFKNTFLRKIITSKSLEHPNIIKFYESEMEKGIPYLATQFIDGQDLKKIINQFAPFKISLAVEIIKQACYGLDYAHRKGVVHSDLKPKNIIIDKDEKVILTDFGINVTVNLYNSLINEGELPFYVAPEYATGEKLNERSDIYSLGIIFYEMLTGNLPFKGQNQYVIMNAHRNELAKDPSLFNPSIPDKICNIVFKMMEKEPEQRYKSAEDVLNEI